MAEPTLLFSSQKIWLERKKIQARSPSKDRHRKMLGKDVWRGGAAQECMELSEYLGQDQGEWDPLQLVYAKIALICNSWSAYKNGKWLV